MRDLATNNNNRAIFSLPGTIVSASPVQKIANQRANRQLSRAALSPSVTPIWRQQIFAPSAELQRRFTPQNDIPNAATATPQLSTEAEGTAKPPAPLAPQPAAVPDQQSLPDDRKQQPTPSTAPDTKPAANAPQPVPSTKPKPASPTLPQDKPQQPPPSQPSPPASDSHETNAELSKSLDAITHIRQQIQSQEQKLKQLEQQTPQGQQEDIDTEQKTKEALVKNLDQAIQNTQTELQTYAAMPGANTTILDGLKKQFRQQKELFNRLVHERDLLAKKKEALKEKALEEQKAKKQLDSLQQQHEQLAQQYPVASSQAAASPSSPPPTAASAPRPAPTQAPTKVVMPAITKQPNAINGIVQNAQGKMITEAIVIIKAADQRPLRALKTNELGQFWITTALENGDYEIQTEKDDLSFGTIKIHLDGSVVEPILIKEQAAS